MRCSQLLIRKPGLDPGRGPGGGGGGGGAGPPPNPENQFENRAKFLCLRVRGEQSPCSYIRNALMLTSVVTKSLKIVIFNHLVLVDANCDDSVTIPRCPNLVVDLKVSVALKKNFTRLHFGHPPYFKSWIHPCKQYSFSPSFSRTR